MNCNHIEEFKLLLLFSYFSIISDSLNGFLKIAGNTGGLIQTEKYSTNETLNFDLDLTDNFYRPVLFTYTWHVNNTLLENQTDSSLSLVLKTPGFCNVSVTVSAQISGVATVMEGTFRVAFFLEGKKGETYSD